MDATDGNIFRDGSEKAQELGVEWTEEMQTAVQNNDNVYSPAIAVQMLGLPKEAAAMLPPEENTFTKAQKTAVRSVLMRKIQREEQEREDANCAALAEQLKLERKYKPQGRPTTFSPEIGDEICRWISNGHSVNKFCQHFGIGHDTVYRWLRQNSAFKENYELAHLDRADLLADQVIDMLDDLGDTVTVEQLALAKLKADTRRWMAAKLRPARWGEKQIAQGGAGGVVINIGIPKPVETIEQIEPIQRIE